MGARIDEVVTTLVPTVDDQGKAVNDDVEETADDRPEHEKNGNRHHGRLVAGKGRLW